MHWPATDVQRVGMDVCPPLDAVGAEQTDQSRGEHEPAEPRPAQAERSVELRNVERSVCLQIVVLLATKPLDRVDQLRRAAEFREEANVTHGGSHAASRRSSNRSRFTSLTGTKGTHR